MKHYKFVYNGENLEPIVKKQIPPQKLSYKVIKLLEILKTLNPEKYEVYEENAVKAFKSYDSCSKIISWVSEAITGFSEVYNYLDKDYNNILFLLYAINYRTICYMKIVGQEESYYESAEKTWKSFYDANLETTDFIISKSDYHDLFMYKKLKDATAYCDKLLSSCSNKKSQVYLAFTMLGMFFSDLYLVLTQYADDFKESIKYKINIKIEENKFHENVPAPRIVVKSDSDRRSAYIELLCNEATAHKMAVLFIKEFDLLINKFEDYFKIIGLKLYYLLPRIDKDRMKNTLDNYNFEAYIPTLIPLLTGDNIYSSKVVFARELIQNSIDAISVREAKDEMEFSDRIMLELKVDESGRRYFKIVDKGTGMDRYKIERYFTSIGRSFYSGEEYEDLNISYKPISSFGIGFLSSFMVCQEIDVKTKYYTDGAEGLKLHIPNYDGCFFIELEKETEVGTELKLYLDDSTTDKNIVDYVRKVMLDIKYPIDIYYINEKEKEIQVTIPAHSIRVQNKEEEFKFFVPFYENGEIGKIDYLEEVHNNIFVEKYEYGLFICKAANPKGNNKNIVLNSGIVVEQEELRDIFGSNFRRGNYEYHSYEEGFYNDMIANFPANWLQLDVARENITGLSKVINNKNVKRMPKTLAVKIADSLYCQIAQYIQYSENRKTNIHAIYLQDIIYYALGFCGKQKSEDELRKKIIKLKYLLSVEFSSKGICYKLVRDGEPREKVRIKYSDPDAKKERDKWKKQMALREIRFPRFMREREEDIGMHKSYFIRLYDEIAQSNGMCVDEGIRLRTGGLMNDMSEILRIGCRDKSVFKLLSLLLLDVPDEVICNNKEGKIGIVALLENVFLHYFCIGKEQKQEIQITYNELLELVSKLKM